MLDQNYSHKFNVAKSYPVYDILNAISDILSKTYGPEGSTTLLEDRNTRHTATKDGYTVLKSLFSTNDLERVVLEFIKRLSMRLVRTVGDGSTSAVIVANQIAQALGKFMDDHPDVARGDIAQCVNDISNAIQDEVMKNSREPSVEDLRNVCMISTNNNKTITDLIVTAFGRIGKFGMIQVERGDKKDSDIVYKTGFELFRGYTDGMFANRNVKDHNFCELEKVRILMIEGRLGGADIKPFSEILNAVITNNESLAVIANSFNEDFVDFIGQNIRHAKGKLPICLIAHGTGTKKGRDHFADAATMFNCTVVQYTSKAETLEKIFFPASTGGELDPTSMVTYLGYAARMTADESTSKFFDCQGMDTEDYKALKSDLQEQIKELGESETQFDYDSKIGALQVRLGRLCGNVAVLTVGGNSIAEIETTSFLAEDAALAARSALQLGVGPAGNLVVPWLLQRKDVLERVKAAGMGSCGGLLKDFVDELINEINDAYINTFTICSRMKHEDIVEMLKRDQIYNVRTKKFEDIDKTVVLNPSRTDKEILMAALSVISLICTSNQFIYTPKSEEIAKMY